jgi:hypothetical protein
LASVDAGPVLGEGEVHVADGVMGRRDRRQHGTGKTDKLVGPTHEGRVPWTWSSAKHERTKAQSFRSIPLQ